MAENKPVVSQPTNKPVVVKSPGVHFSFSRRKKIALTAIVVLLVLLVAGGLFWRYHHKSPNQNTAQYTPNLSTASGTLSYYDHQIASLKGDKAAQANAYYQKAQLYMTQHNYNAALINALKANSLQPNNPVTLETIGDIYSAQGNVKSAVAYYEKDIKVYTNIKDPRFASVSKSQEAHYQQKINQVEGKT